MDYRIAEARKSKGLTQQELADKVGISKQAIYRYESGAREPRINIVVEIAKALGVSVSYLLGLDTADGGIPSFVNVPFYGTIAAGTPIEMLPIDDTKPAPAEIRERYPDSFFLLVRGESMNRVLPNGCYALVNPTSEVENGKPYAVCVDGQAATIKRVRKLAHGFELMPDSTDPTYRPQTFDYNEPGTDTVTVIGEIVYYMLPYNWKF